MKRGVNATGKGHHGMVGGERKGWGVGAWAEAQSHVLIYQLVRKDNKLNFANWQAVPTIANYVSLKLVSLCKVVVG